MSRWAVLVVAGLVAGCSTGSSASAPPAHGTGTTARPVDVPAQRVAVRVEVRDLGRLGPVLVDDTGRTLYVNTREAGGDAGICPVRCRRTWPLVLAPAAGLPDAAAPVRAGLLATTALPGVARALTYAGYPLHRYVGDARPGDASGQGAQRAWSVLSPGGRPAPVR